jgi:hypothetical protein
MRELARWRSSPADPIRTEQVFLQLNNTHPSVFIYVFARGDVQMGEKPEAAGVDAVTQARAEKYLAFFREVARALPETFFTTIAMGVGDKVEFAPSVPVFCFQKRRGNATILAPDIDFLDFIFYEFDEVTDTVAFNDKVDGAIFIGGTTGGQVTPEVARNCSLPRLRAAKFFENHPRVEFRLPQVVQTSNDEAEALLRSYGFCRPGRVGWKQQLQNRFLISMDGNGATCSRVVISLRSNSVLLKYDSDELLYYFAGLQPWLHYIPIARDEDIDMCLNLESWSPGTLERIAREGRDFAQTYLTRPAVTAYMAELLLLYPSCFANRMQAETEVSVAAPPARTKSRLFLVAHIGDVGDREADAEGWVGLESAPRLIEGFSLSANIAGFSSQVSCQAVLAKQALGPVVAGGAYCGTRGKQQPIHGFVLHVAADAPVLDGLVYEGVFADGFRSGPLKPGTVCASPAQAPLVAMRVTP